MINEEEQKENKPGVFRRVGNSVNNAVDNLKERTRQVGVMAQEEMQKSMLQNLIPMIKKMLPSFEAQLKGYLVGKDDGLKKAVLMKVRADGRLEILIFNAEGIEITNSANFKPEEILINQIELDDYILGFLNGKFDSEV